MVVAKKSVLADGSVVDRYQVDADGDIVIEDADFPHPLQPGEVFLQDAHVEQSISSGFGHLTKSRFNDTQVASERIFSDRSSAESNQSAAHPQQFRRSSVVIDHGMPDRTVSSAASSPTVGTARSNSVPPSSCFPTGTIWSQNDAYDAAADEGWSAQTNSSDSSRHRCQFSSHEDEVTHVQYLGRHSAGLRSRQPLCVSTMPPGESMANGEVVESVELESYQSAGVFTDEDGDVVMQDSPVDEVRVEGPIVWTDQGSRGL